MADKTTCPKCSGRGKVTWATEDVECAVCEGTGKVPAAVAKAEDKARESA